VPKDKQPNSLKVRSILLEYVSEFTSTPKGELVCKLCDCAVKSNKRFVVEAHCRSAKHQRGSFHKIESSHFQNMLYQNFHINYFFSYQQNKLIGLCSNTVYEYTLHCVF